MVTPEQILLCWPIDEPGRMVAWDSMMEESEMVVEWWMVAWGWIWTCEPMWTAFAAVGELVVVVVVLVVLGGRDEGVDLGSEVLVMVVEVEILGGRGAPMVALVWMSVLDWMVSGA